jgi:hypothetical protein
MKRLLPASMREARLLGYAYAGGDCLLDGAVFTSSEEATWEGVMEFELADHSDGNLGTVRRRVKLKLVFLPEGADMDGVV